MLAKSILLTAPLLNSAVALSLSKAETPCKGRGPRVARTGGRLSFNLLDCDSEDDDSSSYEQGRVAPAFGAESDDDSPLFGAVSAAGGSSVQGPSSAGETGGAFSSDTDLMPPPPPRFLAGSGAAGGGSGAPPPTPAREVRAPPPTPAAREVRGPPPAPARELRGPPPTPAGKARAGRGVRDAVWGQSERDVTDGEAGEEKRGRSWSEAGLNPFVPAGYYDEHTGEKRKRAEDSVDEECGYASPEEVFECGYASPEEACGTPPASPKRSRGCDSPAGEDFLKEVRDSFLPFTDRVAEVRKANAERTADLEAATLDRALGAARDALWNWVTERSASFRVSSSARQTMVKDILKIIYETPLAQKTAGSLEADLLAEQHAFNEIESALIQGELALSQHDAAEEEQPKGCTICKGKSHTAETCVFAEDTGDAAGINLRGARRASLGTKPVVSDEQKRLFRENYENVASHYKKKRTITNILPGTPENPATPFRALLRRSYPPNSV